MPGRAAAVRRRLLLYGDDIELGWRLQQRGIRQAKVPTALVEHDASTGSRNGSMFYEYHMARAHWLLAGKVAGNRSQHVLYLAGRALFLPLRASLRAFRQRTMVPVRALLPLPGTLRLAVVDH